MRLGGPVMEPYANAEEWVAAHVREGYSAAYWPNVAEDQEAEYLQAAVEANIIIAEVGAWSNPIGLDAETTEAAIQQCIRQLRTADRIGARCAVNIAGSRSTQWDGPDLDNYSAETFERIVQSVQRIIDEVQPTRSFYTLEMMGWIYPDCADHYLQLIAAIDRKQFAVHLDPVNIVNSPRLYNHTAALIDECFDKLGPYIKSCHAKDVLIQSRALVHLDEVRPGLGVLDYPTYLRRLNQLDEDTPLMLEHLETAEQYRAAAAFIRQTANEANILFKQ